MLLSPNTPSAADVESSRMGEYRHVEVIACSTRWVKKYCHTSTSFESPASRETSQALEFQLSLFVMHGTRYVEIFVWGNVDTFTTLAKVPNQDCSVVTELVDGHDGFQ